MDLGEMVFDPGNNHILRLGHTSMVKRLTNNAGFPDPVVRAALNSRGPLEPSTESMTMAHKVHTYADLLHQIRNDLRIQHPEWIRPNGECPMCDSYEARLTELLVASLPCESNNNIAPLDRELSQR
jgi:hypothetical protein